jgi:hypothetical protein
MQIFVQRADGRDLAEPLTGDASANRNGTEIIPYSTCSDKSITIAKLHESKGGAELFLLRPPSPESHQAWRQEPIAIEIHTADGAPQLSSDCQLIAFVIDESGNKQIYVQDFPGLTHKWRIDSGSEPVWGSHGHTLFYRGSNYMRQAEIGANGDFPKLARLFKDIYKPTPPPWARPNYDVSRDGNKFLMLEVPADESATPLNTIEIVQNWSEVLNGKMSVH